MSLYLRGFGVVGWDRFEPVLLAALATEDPLLLIGPHGTAKTLLLTRLAEGLGLRHRHYNASLLNFDDLIGFPVPEGGKLVYLQTPATIWEAESVFFDEVSRCRPEMQNKLFPVVHERRIQGVRLEALRYRWAAMNPAPSLEGDADGPEYAGAEPLDVALADRFAWVVEAPALRALGAEDQDHLLRQAARALVEGVDGPSEPNDVLAGLIADTRARIAGTDPERTVLVAGYVRHLAGRLGEAGHPLSTRRAAQVVRNLVAGLAAREALGLPAEPKTAFVELVRCSLPDAAWGAPVCPHTLEIADRGAWYLLQGDDDARLRRISTADDPLLRLVLALDPDLPPEVTGEFIADAWSGMTEVGRVVAAAVVMPRVLRRQPVPAAAVELMAEAYGAVLSGAAIAAYVAQDGEDWRRPLMADELPRLDTTGTRDRQLHNIAAALINTSVPFNLEQLRGQHERAREIMAWAIRTRWEAA